MDIYICKNCKKIFQRRENLEYHEKHDACKNRKFECKYCDKSFTTSANMYRHMKHSCNIRKINDEKKNEIYERLLKLEADNEKIKINHKKEIENLKKQFTKNKNTINGSVNNGTINNIQNIILVGYGKEDMSKIDQKELLKVLQNGYNSTVKLAEAVHFNPKYPEYHNIYISNMRDKYAMMFDGINWTLTIKEELINKIYDDKKNYIEENLEEFIGTLSVSRRNALNRWIDTDENDSKVKEIKDNIKLLLYNMKHIPLKKINESTPLLKSS